MTTEQLFLILGTIYIAPHAPSAQGLVAGYVLLLAGAIKALGWI